MVLHATNLCIHGSRVKWRRTEIEDGAGLPYFKVRLYVFFVVLHYRCHFVYVISVCSFFCSIVI